MDYGSMIRESIGYTSNAFWGKWGRWVLLIVSTIIFPLIYGYSMEVYRGKRPAPEPTDWAKLFIDGLKLIVAAIIYAIPVIIVLLLFGGLALIDIIGTAVAAGDPDIFASNPELFLRAFAEIAVGIILAVFLALLISLISTIGIVRLARTDRFGEAFNFNAILETIGRIGWGTYIVALIVLWVASAVWGVIVSVLTSIPIIGWIIGIILMPVWIVFAARYITLVYNQGESPGGRSSL